MAISRRKLIVAAASAGVVGTGALAAMVQARSKTRLPRTVRMVVDGTLSRDGAGVKLRRMLAGRALSMLDPFLLFDEFKSRDPQDFIAGFPDHPHRGFETVTLMVDGEVAHKDSVGNSGVIAGGGVQWMTAGRGIIHAEMPRAAASGELWGYQLWVNLPARLKMTKPRYQDLSASAFTPTQVDDARVRVLAGRLGAARGPVDGIAVDPLVADVSLEAGARLRQDIPAGHNVFVQLLEGGLRFVGGARADERSLVVLGPGDAIELEAEAGGARALVIAGAPIGEPVARRGPFVMNTDAEIRKAFDDYRSGRLTDG